MTVALVSGTLFELLVFITLLVKLSETLNRFDVMGESARVLTLYFFYRLLLVQPWIQEMDLPLRRAV